MRGIFPVENCDHYLCAPTYQPALKAGRSISMMFLNGLAWASLVKDGLVSDGLAQSVVSLQVPGLGSFRMVRALSAVSTVVALYRSDIVTVIYCLPPVKTSDVTLGRIKAEEDGVDMEDHWCVSCCFLRGNQHKGEGVMGRNECLWDKEVSEF